MESPIRPLVARLYEIPDPRHPRGRRHSLAAILALMCVAMLCGDRSYSAIADWGRCYGQKLARALGFTNAKTPCASACPRFAAQRWSALALIGIIPEN